VVGVSTVEDDRVTLARKSLLQARLQRPVSQAGLTRPVPRRVDSGAAPLSAAQLQLWYLNRLAPESIAYNELITIRKDGSFDAEAFTWAFNEVIRRHEAWRTTFVVFGDEPRQVVHQHTPIELPVRDLTQLSFAEAEATAARLAAEVASAPYDFASGPMLRPMLMRLSPTHHRLYLAMHHLIFDGVSLYRIVLPELVALYNAHQAGSTPPLPDPPIQYSDYAAWQRDWVQGSEVDRRLTRCRERLAGVTPLNLPLDHPRPARQRFRGSMVPITVDSATGHSLRTIAANHDATLFQIIAAVYAYWLRSYTEHDDVVFATAHDLRHAPELESMVGYCLTPVVLRINVAATETCVGLLARMRTEVLDAIECAVPFEHLVRAIDPPRDQRRNPLFQTALVLEPPMLARDPAWSIHQMETAVGTLVGQSKFDISVELDERSDGRICGRLIYNTDLFDTGTAELMQRHFVRLLRNVATDPDLPLAVLSQPDERDVRELVEFNPPPLPAATAAQGRCIHELIVDQAARSPEAVAVLVADQQLSYQDLLHRSQHIAARLTEAGAGPGVVVAVCMDRCIQLVPTLLGILLAGSAYLPLDPNQPDSRSSFMMADAGATVLVTDSIRRPISAQGEIRVVCVADDGTACSDDHLPRFVPGESVPADVAYVIYTSGSTGAPKGVQVEHRNVVNLMMTMPARVGLSSADTVVSVASYTFDVSVGDIFVTLALGATLVLATDAQTRDPRQLDELIERREATYLGATPTTWSMLLAAGWTGRPELLAVCWGEPLPDRLAAELRRRCRAVWNGWGPTEATVIAGGGFVVAGEPVTVGSPLPGVRIYVLDKAGRVVPCGVPGEIVIAGRGVSRGYVNRPEESAQRFGLDPVVDGDRMYRTGDRGRLLADGRLQHLGRYDNQVKIRGFRVEVGEVESVLAEYPDAAEVAVAVREDDTGQPQLVAYLVGACGGNVDVEVRRWAASRLPAYMVPSVIVHIAALPMSASGKLDCSALPAPPRPPAPSRPRVAESELEASRHRRLAKLWSELLPGTVEDPHQDFFELGGHSVLAVRLLGEVERRLGVSIAVADFLESGTTLARLGMLVDQAAESGAAATARRGGRPRLFVVYPDLSSSMSLRHLSKRWEGENEVHPLITPALWGGVGGSQTVDAMAAPLLRMIREAQPGGPYRLMGYSFGGLLTYELARLLRANGEQVAWLGLLDTPTPEVLGHVLRKWKSPSVQMARLREPKKLELITGYARSVRWLVHEKLIAASLTRRRIGQRFDDRHAFRIALGYCPDGHHIPMDLFVTTDTVDEAGSASLGWDRVHLGPLHVHTAPGDHDTLLTEPVVSELAGLISASLKNASPSPQITAATEGVTA
jgi:amino acid adenylation domain-containing protein